jgi:hypothetical protein
MRSSTGKLLLPVVLLVVMLLLRACSRQLLQL